MNSIDSKITTNRGEWNGLMEYLLRCPWNMEKDIIARIDLLNLEYRALLTMKKAENSKAANKIITASELNNSMMEQARYKFNDATGLYDIEIKGQYIGSIQPATLDEIVIRYAADKKSEIKQSPSTSHTKGE